MKFGKRAPSIFKRTETIIICAVLAALMLAYYLYSTSSHNAYPETAYGKPTASTEYPKMDISMEQIVEAGQYLYVLHHHSNGIVQVYDLSGTYLHTLFFYCHGKGGFFLAADGQYVYVQDMRNNVYILTGGEFDSFLEKADAEQQLQDIDFHSGASSANYEIRSDGIWRVEETGEQCIIESSANNRRTVDSLFLLVYIAFAVIMLYQCRKRK